MTSDKIFADFKVSSKYRTYLYLSISAFYVRHFAFLQEIFRYCAPNINSTTLKKGPESVLFAKLCQKWCKHNREEFFLGC